MSILSISRNNSICSSILIKVNFMFIFLNGCLSKLSDNKLYLLTKFQMSPESFSNSEDTPFWLAEEVSYNYLISKLQWKTDSLFSIKDYKSFWVTNKYLRSFFSNYVLCNWCCVFTRESNILGWTALLICAYLLQVWSQKSWVKFMCRKLLSARELEASKLVYDESMNFVHSFLISSHNDTNFEAGSNIN